MYKLLCMVNTSLFEMYIPNIAVHVKKKFLYFILQYRLYNKWLCLNASFYCIRYSIYLSLSSSFNRFYASIRFPKNVRFNNNIISLQNKHLNNITGRHHQSWTDAKQKHRWYFSVPSIKCFLWSTSFIVLLSSIKLRNILAIDKVLVVYMFVSVCVCVRACLGNSGERERLKLSVCVRAHVCVCTCIL